MLQGELNHVNEKLAQCQQAYQFSGQNFPAISVVEVSS
jgi:hypothetical protein